MRCCIASSTTSRLKDEHNPTSTASSGQPSAASLRQIRALKPLTLGTRRGLSR